MSPTFQEMLNSVTPHPSHTQDLQPLYTPLKHNVGLDHEVDLCQEATDQFSGSTFLRVEYLSRRNQKQGNQSNFSEKQADVWSDVR